MSLASISQNISANVPVDIQWSGNGKVSICVLPSALSSFISNAPTTQPVDLKLSPRGSGVYSFIAESSISNSVTGDSYVWTPSDSLVLGGFYLIGLWQQGQQFGSSHDLVCTEFSTTVTVIIYGTIPPAPASQSSASHSSASHSSTSHSSTSYSSASQSPDLRSSPARQHKPSQGTIACAAIGVAIFILLILTSATLCWRRRRPSSQKAAIELPGHQTDAKIKLDPHTTIWVPELGQEGAVNGPHELPGTPTSMGESARAGDSCAAEERVFEVVESG